MKRIFSVLALTACLFQHHFFCAESTFGPFSSPSKGSGIFRRARKDGDKLELTDAEIDKLPTTSVDADSDSIPAATLQDVINFSARQSGHPEPYVTHTGVSPMSAADQVSTASPYTRGGTAKAVVDNKQVFASATASFEHISSSGHSAVLADSKQIETFSKGSNEGTDGILRRKGKVGGLKERIGKESKSMLKSAMETAAETAHIADTSMAATGASSSPASATAASAPGYAYATASSGGMPAQFTPSQGRTTSTLAPADDSEDADVSVQEYPAEEFSSRRPRVAVRAIVERTHSRDRTGLLSDHNIGGGRWKEGGEGGVLASHCETGNGILERVACGGDRDASSGRIGLAFGVGHFGE